MKRILGLDLGTTSIGWALVNESEDSTEPSSIIKLGVRISTLTSNERTNFETGKAYETTKNRTLKRGARRNLQRYKLRREQLKQLLIEKHIISENDILSKNGPNTTYQTIRLRAKAVSERIELHELARVLLAINKKRGYKKVRPSYYTRLPSFRPDCRIQKNIQFSTTVLPRTPDRLTARHSHFFTKQHRQNASKQSQY